MHRDPLTVSEVNQSVQALLDRDPILRNLYVKGEISQAKQYPSGHFYFTIKDEKASVSCVSFRSDFQNFPMVPKVGDKVLLRARANLYPASGRFQLIVSALEAEGEGVLWQRFEQLKKALEAKGYFKKEHKKKLPYLPQKIAFISSPAGAVIHDFVSVLRRRFPGFQLVLIPALVQGEGSAASLVRALALADQLQDVEVVVLARGGGSIEDLWSFNEEIVADQIFRMKKPVISAVGHESDVTIADFVADLRAPTPSAAAELVLPEKLELVQTLDLVQARFEQSLLRRLRLEKEKLSAWTRALKLLGQGGLPKERERMLRAKNNLKLQHERILKRLEMTQKQLALNEVKRRIILDFNQSIRSVKQARDRLDHLCEVNLKNSSQRLNEASRQLHNLSPLNVLKRGYAVLKDSNGAVLTDPKQVKMNTLYELILEKGPLWVKRDDR